MTYKEKLEQLELDYSNKLDAYIGLRDEICAELGHCSTIEADRLAKQSGDTRYFEVKEAYLNAAYDFNLLRNYISKTGLGTDTHYTSSPR